MRKTIPWHQQLNIKAAVYLCLKDKYPERGWKGGEQKEGGCPTFPFVLSRFPLTLHLSSCSCLSVNNPRVGKLTLLDFYMFYLFENYESENLLFWEQIINQNVKYCIEGQHHWGSWLLVNLQWLVLNDTDCCGLISTLTGFWILDDSKCITKDVDKMHWSSEDSKFKYTVDI